ncbi:MAG: squalene/phytoene synthase family protein [Alphaproteobacteria bacterium]
MTRIIETPSGKGAKDENFPVAQLFSAAARPAINSYYAFARAIDDIADNPSLPASEKIQRLEGFDRALLSDSDDPGYAKAVAVRDLFEKRRIPIAHARDLITAFKQDAQKLRYRDWDDLISYCLNSAAPVGRFLLDLHQEDRSAYPQSDALCNALQIINHLQDCKADYIRMNRVYIPEPWLHEVNLDVSCLASDRANPSLRSVLDRCLDGVEALMIEARKLPSLMKNPQLSRNCQVIVMIADKLAQKLRREDPIAGRVQLNKLQFLIFLLWSFIKKL